MRMEIVRSVFQLFTFISFILDDLLNDFWMWDPRIRQWTWLTGSSSVTAVSNFGTINSPSPTNVPGARTFHAMDIDPNTGIIYLFGGQGTKDMTKSLNDLWKWDPTNSYWSWISGTQNANMAGSYGSLGVSSTLNTPGGRYWHSLVVDVRTGYLYVFAGYGYDASGKLFQKTGFETYFSGTNGHLNDLWSWDPKKSQWTWLSGGKTQGNPGNYGSKLSPSVNNLPPSRRSHATALSAANGTIYIHGGYNGVSGKIMQYKFSDLFI